MRSLSGNCYDPRSTTQDHSVLDKINTSHPSLRSYYSSLFRQLQLFDNTDNLEILDNLDNSDYLLMKQTRNNAHS
jgi:hypothetical protein